MTSDLSFHTIRDLGRMLRCRQISAVELTEHFLDRLERLGPRFNAVVTVTRELALKQAREAQRELDWRVDRGPLHGIPFGAKDLISAAGIPTTWGAAPLKDQVFDYDAAVITKLREAGAVLCAKLATVELAGGMGYDHADASFTGPGRTPWSLDAWSGGSSAGPGAAVAAGLVPFAIGSETAGSIMCPASFCGVSGLRPTYGRVSRHGAMTLSWTLDKLGPLARTADDCGLVLAALAGPDPRDSATVNQTFAYPTACDPHRRFRFGVLSNAVEKVQPEVKANFEQSLDALRRFGSVESVTLPGFPFDPLLETILGAEMASAFDEFIDKGQIAQLTAAEDRIGGYAVQMILAKDYIRALRIQNMLNRKMEECFRGFAAVVAPTTPYVATLISKAFSEYDAAFSWTDLIAASNLAGIPAISIPNGFGERGLPTGIQFVGNAFDESTLLFVANGLQQVTDWHAKHPEI